MNSQTDNLWTIENPKSILLSWDKLPFSTKTSIKWRGTVIHIRIKANQTETGWTRVITFLYKDKLYHCGLAKWKWTGGGYGVYPPEISTSTNKLTISTGGAHLRMKDDLIEPYEIDDKVEHPFEIFTTPNEIVFDEPKPEIIKEPIKPKIEKNQVKLYEYKGSSIDINSYAYFEAENLVIDYWKLGDDYEDEYFITVLKKNINILYKEFEIHGENNAELLIAILNAFKGENSFENFKNYLAINKIPFENGVRHS